MADPKKRAAAARVPAVVSHTALALQKKGYSKRAAWNIARGSLTKYGHLKGPYREGDKGVPKMTKKGQRASARHSGERDAPQKFKRFTKDFGDVVETHHRSDGKFASPDAAHFVMRNGERLRVVRQLRRAKNRTLDKSVWGRDGEHLVLGRAKYRKITPSDVTSALRDAAPLFKIEVPPVKVIRETPYIVRLDRGDGWDAAVMLALATNHDFFADPWAEGGGVTGKDALAGDGPVYMMRRV